MGPQRDRYSIRFAVRWQWRLLRLLPIVLASGLIEKPVTVPG